MKILLPLILLLAGLSHNAQAQSAEPEVYVVKYYADWCGSCRVMDPVMEEAKEMANLDDSDALFVTLDLTDATTSKQAELLASSLGLGDYYAENAGKTGYMILVDTDTGEIEGTITADMTAEQMVAEVNRFL